MKKAIALFLVVVLMLATSSVALATGSSLHHDGNSRYSYYTSDYVAQKNDPYFDCDSCALGGTFDVGCAVYHSGYGWEVFTSLQSYTSNSGFVLNQYPTVRRVHLYIENTGGSYGVLTSSEGDWTLSS
jgi:hypothetical protein